MEIITMVKGKIPESSLEDFKAAYASMKEETLPEGLIASYLLRDMIESDLYTVETVWATPETLKKMMGSDETTADVKLFEKFDVQPSIEVHEVRDNYPQFEE
jgi:heme-degrading monooxygenase HmoA